MDFLTNIDGSNVNLTPKGIILWNAMFESNLPVLNCILIFKYYLYVCKLKDMLPNLNAGLQYLNSEIKIEKYSATVAILERIWSIDNSLIEWENRRSNQFSVSARLLS